MVWQETPYTIPLIVTTVILAAAAVYTWWRSFVAGARVVALLIFIGAIFILTYTVEVSSTDMPTKVFWDKIQFLSMTVVPVLWLNYVLQFTGHEKWVTRRNLLLLAIVPVILTFLAFTNEYHRLIWGRVVLSDEDILSELGKTYNIGYDLFLVYSYVLILAGIFLLVRMLVHARYSYYQQNKTLVFAVFFPLAGITLYLLGVNPFLDIGADIYIIVVIALMVAWSFVQLRLGDVVYVAFGTVVESIDDSVLVLDLQNRIVDANSSALHLIGCSISEAGGQFIKQVWPHLFDFVEHIHYTEDIGGEVTIDLEEEQHIYDVRVSPLIDWRNRITGHVVVLRDITRRKQTEEKIRASLKEKEVLLKEIHHRVNNNLQIISSLLSLQSEYVKDARCTASLEESRNRIRTMALVHEKLYQSENLASINLKEYVKSLVSGLVRSYRVNTDRITPKTNVEDIFLGVDTAIPCGLIINELVSNALKHAFPDRKGEITVTLHSVDDIIELTVSDNGIGIPDNIDFKAAETLGLHLVTILAEDQLEGEITLDRSKGTSFKITFKVSE